jgi:NitT/TauT family transport system ATP-binding protein
MNEPQEPPATSQLSLPEMGISQILGLVELLIGKGGREDIYKLAGELSMELGETLTVIKAAEMLGLVNTPGGDVVVEDFGHQVIDASITERKDLIRHKLELLPVFKSVEEFLNNKDDGEVGRDEVLEKLAELIPNDDAETSFSTMVNWGRYAEIFGYNDDTQTFYLDNEDEEDADPETEEE